jgi:hypothetical protein
MCFYSGLKPYQPYGDINSTYQKDYPGHRPQMREKLAPRVKGDDHSIPFNGESE